MEKKEMEFDIRVNTADMYNFLLAHTYSTFSGLFSIFLSFGALGLYFFGNTDSQNIILLIVAGLFLVVNPLQLLLKAKQQVALSPVFQEPIHYLVTEEGIIVSQKEEELKVEWNQICRAVENKRSIIIYLSKINAYILPKAQIGSQCPEFKEVLREKVKKEFCRLKK